MKKQKIKRGISFLASIVLSITLLPINAFAAVATPTSPVTVEKTTEWVDFENKIAEVTLEVNAADQNVSTFKTSDIVFAIDSSGSMSTDALTNVRTAITNFTNSILPDVAGGKARIGIVKFEDKAVIYQNLTNNKNTITNKISGNNWFEYIGDGSTNIQAGIEKAETMLSDSPADNKYIILLSDGEPTHAYKATAGSFEGITTKSACYYSWGKLKHKITASYTSFEPTAFEYDNANVVKGSVTISKSVNGKCAHNISCTTTIKHDVTPAEATKYEADKARAAGIQMVAIGYGSIDAKGIDVLKSVADTDKYYTSADNGIALTNLLAQINEEVTNFIPSGTDAVLAEDAGNITIDGQSVECNIVPDSLTNVNATNSGNLITWNIGILPNGTVTLKYRVQITSDLTSGINNVDFGRALLTYTKDGATVEVNSPTQVLHYYTVKYNSFYEENYELVPVTLSTAIVESGTTVNAPALTETAGYTFEWPTGQESVIVNEEDITVTATSQIKSYDVTFEVYDENENKIYSDTKKVEYNNDATIPSDIPTQVGHTLTPWEGNFTNITEATTLKAHLLPNNYNVTFYDWNGEILSGPTSVSYGNSITPPVAKRTGYKFTGWDVQFDIPAPVSPIDNLNDQDDDSNSQLDNSDSQTDDSNGQTDDSNGQTDDSDSQLDNSDSQTDDSNGQTDDSNGQTDDSNGQDGDIVTGEKSISPSLSSAPDAELSSPSLDYVTGDLKATAQYKIKVKNVTFINEGVLYESQKVDWGSLVPATIQGDPSKEYNKFIGWAYNNGTEDEPNYVLVSDEDIVKKDITLYAQFENIPCKVTFKNGDETFFEETVNAGTSVILPEGKPTKLGYEFEKWDEIPEVVTEDITISAVFKILTFKVSFVNFDGSLLSEPQTIDYGSSATAPANPTRSGYTFTGWNKNFSNITADIIVTAQYSYNGSNTNYTDDTPTQNIPDEQVPTANIPDEQVPTANIPNEQVPTVEIPTEPIPKASVPDTGEHNSHVYFITALSSLVVLACVCKKKSNLVIKK